jgi:hypothetical protein
MANFLQLGLWIEKLMKSVKKPMCPVGSRTSDHVDLQNIVTVGWLVM